VGVKKNVGVGDRLYKPEKKESTGAVGNSSLKKFFFELGLRGRGEKGRDKRHRGRVWRRGDRSCSKTVARTGLPPGKEGSFTKG